MPLTDLSPEQASIVEQAQKYTSLVPTIVLGSGASSAHAIPGMEGLKNYLLKKIEPQEENDKAAWEKFKAALDATNDLENSLQKVQISDELLLQVVRETHKLINEADYNVFLRVISDEETLSLSSLIRHLFQTTHPKLSIITTNYDRLAEYAVNAAGYSFYTGFSDGYIQFQANYHPPLPGKRRVDIWKVHGSLDWHTGSKSDIISFPFLNALPDIYVPLIVTPGIRKFEQTHQDPYRTIITGADQALSEAQSYLVWGYGFKDPHIQPKLVNKVYRDNTPIIVLSKELTHEAKAFLFNEKCKKFVAFEQSGEGTIAYTASNQQGVLFPDSTLWNLDEFLGCTI